MNEMEMSADDVARYVDAAAAANGLTLTPKQREGVIVNFARTADIAAPLIALELPDDVEMAPVFHP